jgi:hypothetical protein
MPTVEKFLLGGTITTLITTGSSLAATAWRSASAYDNTVGQTGDGYTLCDLEFVGHVLGRPGREHGPAGVVPPESQNGTNYEDGDGTVGGSADTTPARLPDAVIPLRAVTTAQRSSRSVAVAVGQVEAAHEERRDRPVARLGRHA